MTDMRTVIIPKSDQLNADDLIGGPRTVTITSVSVRPGTEQPVAISFEGDGGKPYKPCKSMCRVMVTMWGPDAKAYTGRSLTLYRDPDVTWAGMKVGGIRISNMSDIEREHTMALTVTKQSRKPYTVKPLRAQQPPATSAKQQSAPPPSEPPTPEPESSLAEQLDHLEPDEWKQTEGRVEDERQAEMMPAREWTKEDVDTRGKEIAAALRDHGGALTNLEGAWRLAEDEIMTMPVGAQKGLRKVFDDQRTVIEADEQKSRQAVHSFQKGSTQ